MIFLLDSTVIVDALNGRDRALDKLSEILGSGGSLITTVINVAEIYAGARPGEELRTAQFFDAMQVVQITYKMATQAGLLKNKLAKKGRTVGLDDMLIAVAAVELNATLLTENYKDFAHVPNLQLDKQD